MLKKSLSLLLALCLVLTMGAGFASANSGKIELAFWEMYGAKSGMHDLVEQFNQQSDTIHVNVEYYATHEDLLQKLQVTAASGSGAIPNIVFFDCIKVAVADELLGCVDLTPYLEADDQLKFDDFYPVYQTFSKAPDGRILSLHGWSNCLLLYYNKALFREAGLDPEAYPKSWAEQIEMGKKLTDPAKGVWGFQPNFTLDTSAEGHSWEWQSQTVAAGGKIWNDDYSKLMFNQGTAAEEALQFYIDVIYNEQIGTLSPPEKAFVNGMAAMQIAGTWMSNEFTAALGDDLGVGVWYGKDGGSAPNVGGEHFMIIKSDKQHEDASWEFIKYFFRPEVNVVIAQNNGQVPTTKTVAESEAYTAALKIPAIAANIESVEHAITRAPRTDYPTLTEVSYKYIQLALYQELSPKDAIQQMYDELVQKMDDVG